MAVELNTFVTGKQDPVALRTRTTDPDVIGNQGFLYQKDIGGGVKELFYKDPDTGDDIVQITDGDNVNMAAAISDFTGLADTPGNYAGSANFLLRVNGTPDAVEFLDPSTDFLTQYLLADGSRGLSANWDAGSFEIRAQTFQSDIVTGTAPLIVASTTKVANLNADLLDGASATATPTASAIPIADGSNKLASGWISEVIALVDLSDVAAKTGSGTTVVMDTLPTLNGAIIDVTNAEALLVRKDADAGDVFAVNTTTPGVLVTGTLGVTGVTTLNTVAYTWPGADGASGQALTTNGAGTLSWAAVGGPGSDTTAFHDGGDAGYTGVIGTTDAVTLSLHTNGVERFRIGGASTFNVDLIAPAGVNQRLIWYRTTTLHATLGLEASAEQNVPDSLVDDIILRLSSSARSFWITTDGGNATAAFHKSFTKLRGGSNLLQIAPSGLNDASNILFQSRTEASKFQFGWGHDGGLVTGGDAEPGYSAIVHLANIPFYFSLDGGQGKNWLTRVVSTIPRIGTDLVKEFQIETNGGVRHHFSATGEVGNGLVNPGVTSGTNGVGALYHLANVGTIPTGTPTGGGAILYATGGDFRVLANQFSVTANGTEGLRVTSTQRVLGQNGNSFFPTWSFIFDDDTGMFRSGPDRLGFATDGALRVEIDASGNAQFTQDVEIDGALNHDGTLLGLFGTAPVVQGAAIADLTDSSGGTANDTIALITNVANAGSADVGPVQDAIADLAAKVNAALDRLRVPGWIAT